MNALKGLTHPLKIKEGVIVDATGKPVIEVNRNSLETPLNPAGRDALLALTCALLNESFEYDKADILLARAGY
jgi:hypothetical protein